MEELAVGVGFLAIFRWRTEGYVAGKSLTMEPIAKMIRWFGNEGFLFRKAMNEGAIRFVYSGMGGSAKYECYLNSKCVGHLMAKGGMREVEFHFDVSHLSKTTTSLEPFLHHFRKGGRGVICAIGQPKNRKAVLRGRGKYMSLSVADITETVHYSKCEYGEVYTFPWFTVRYDPHYVMYSFENAEEEYTELAYCVTLALDLDRRSA